MLSFKGTAKGLMVLEYFSFQVNSYTSERVMSFRFQENIKIPAQKRVINLT
jgi:hypothetical protein